MHPMTVIITTITITNTPTAVPIIGIGAIPGVAFPVCSVSG